MPNLRFARPPAPPPRLPVLVMPANRQYLGTPIAIAGAAPTAVAVSSGAGTVALGVSGVFVVGATARVSVSSPSSTSGPTLTDTDIWIVGDTASLVNVTAGAGLMTMSNPPGSTQGDYFTSPIIVTGLTGSVTVQLQAAGSESWETFPYFGHETSGTVWVAFTAPLSGELQLSCAVDPTQAVDVWGGTSPDTLVDLGVAILNPSTSVMFYVTADELYFIRMIGSTPADLGWALAPGSGALTVIIQNTRVQETPSVISVQINGAAPSEQLTVSVEGTSGGSYSNVVGMGLGATTTFVMGEDGTGVIGVPVPGVSAGTYQLKVSGATSGTSASTFTVLNDAQLPPAAGGASNPFVPVVQPDVIRWIFQDPAPGGLGTYVFPVNPSEMTSPHAPRNVTWDHTAAPSGPFLAWDTAQRATEWRFSGYVLTQAHHQALAAFAALNRRFWIADHFERRWLVAFEQFSPDLLNDPNQPWAAKYQATVLVFGQGGS
jgi:hypothetical protein